MKLYKYDYGNKLKKLASLFCAYFALIIEYIFFSFVIVIFSILCINVFKDNLIIKYVVVVLSLIINVFMLILFLKIILRKDGVILDNNKIIIRRKIHYKFKLTYQIKYENIDVCQEYNGEVIPSYYRELYNFPILWFNWDNIVIIIDNKKNTYYLPVQNANEFIYVVNKYAQKAKFFSNLNIDDSLLKNKGLSYNDLNVRWKSKDKIDSIYYIDNMGNKVELIKY